jgi:hypothetical protein
LTLMAAFWTGATVGAPFVRQYLEYKLGQIITKLEIPVPPDYATRGDKRTLSTYIDAIADAVDLYKAANRCVLDPQQIIDLQTHHAPSIMCNSVSHYETAIARANLGIEKLRFFFRLAVELHYLDRQRTPPAARTRDEIERLIGLYGPIGKKSSRVFYVFVR